MVSLQEVYESILKYQADKPEADTDDLIIHGEQLLGHYESDQDVEVAGEWVRRLQQHGKPAASPRPLA